MVNRESFSFGLRSCEDLCVRVCVSAKRVCYLGTCGRGGLCAETGSDVFGGWIVSCPVLARTSGSIRFDGSMERNFVITTSKKPAPQISACPQRRATVRPAEQRPKQNQKCLLCPQVWLDPEPTERDRRGSRDGGRAQPWACVGWWECVSEVSGRPLCDRDGTTWTAVDSTRRCGQSWVSAVRQGPVSQVAPGFFGGNRGALSSLRSQPCSNR